MQTGEFVLSIASVFTGTISFTVFESLFSSWSLNVQVLCADRKTPFQNTRPPIR